MLTTIILAITLQQKTFNFDHKAAPVARVVAAMADALDEEMSADGTLSRDIVIVAFRKTTPDRARELLAKALKASWVQKDDKLILHRSRAQRQEDVAADRSQRVEFMRGLLDGLEVPERVIGKSADEYIQEIVRAAASGKAMYNQNELRQRAPVRRGLHRLLKDLGPELLASLPAGAPTIFTLQGGFVSKRLPSSAGPIIREMLSDHVSLVERLEARAGNIIVFHDLTKIDPSPGAVSLVLTTGFYYLSARIKIERPESGELTAWANPPEIDLSVLADHQWPDGLRVPIDLSDLAKERMALHNAGFTDLIERSLPSKELLDVYLKPESHDHLELASSQIVRQAADACGKSFVVVPQDRSGSMEIRLGRLNSPPIMQALELVYHKLFTRSELYDDAVLLMPRMPATARKDRIGRREFAAALKAMRERKQTLLEPLANMVATTNLLGASRAFSLLSSLSRAMTRMHPNGSHELLMVYSRMTDAQRAAAAQGGIVLMPSDLSEEEQGLLSRTIGRRIQEDASGQWYRARDVTDAFYPNLTRNTRELRRLAGGFAIKISVAREPSLFYMAANDYVSRTPQAVSPERIAFWAARGNRTPEEHTSQSVYYEVVEDLLVATVVVGGREIFAGAYYVPSIYEDDAFVSFSKLSPEMIRRYEVALASERKRRSADPPN
ncbi:MAG: hypothetical protein IH945_07900 [Armatimonadetes bacterium]|nr:hypothetical protein [Armatimonadota bacterium]